MLKSVNVFIVLISRGGRRVINELPGELGPGNVRPPAPTIQHYFWTLTLCKHFSDCNLTIQFPDCGHSTGTYIFGLWSQCNYKFPDSSPNTTTGTQCTNSKLYVLIPS